MRVPGWRGALFDYIRYNRDTPYTLGENDCWIFVTGAVTAMTDVDVSKPHRGNYKTVRGALGIIRRAGASNMADFAATYFKELPSPLYAQIGDIMAIPTDDAFGFALGVLTGERIQILTENGIDSHDRSEATRAFGV